MKRWLYLLHRWVGIVLCVFMAAWFLSGMVMMYVGYPKLTDAERWQGLPALPSQGCCVPLAKALGAAGLPSGGKDAKDLEWRLTSAAGRPLYVFSAGGRRSGVLQAVDALSGQRVAAVDAGAALASARPFAQGAEVRHLGLVTEDAWTHSKALDPHRPLHVVAVADEADRWLYVSSRTGEVVRDASFVERSWGWIGAWLHWLYLFRGGAVDAWWHEIIVGLSLAGCGLALTGLVVGVLRWRWRTPYRHGRRTPYLEFHARWHHWLGLGGGVLALTWVLSGLLSVNPWKVFEAPGAKPDRAAYSGGPLIATQVPEAAQVLTQLADQGLSAKELVWQRVGGEPFVLALGGARPQVFSAKGWLPDGVPAARWHAAALALMPHARRVAESRLEHYDAYYYSRAPHTMNGARDRPLPVWRLQFDDANATTLTIDPHTGALLLVQDGHRRASRWLFAFLHSFDLPGLLAARPWWDVGMLGFSLAGLGLSLTGAVVGARRLRRKLS